MNSGEGVHMDLGLPRTGPLPLRGVVVCDFTWIIAGAQATRILADLGALVIKVENEAYPDLVRGSSGLHNNFNRNKLGLTANLHHPMGREVVERLIARSDVVMENYSSGAFARMGFPYERLCELRDDIIYVSLSGFGQAGRDWRHGTWGPTAQGISGLTAMSAHPGREPAGWGYSYLDHTAGFHGAIAALMALWSRRQTGKGQHVDMSQVEGGMALTGVPMLDFQVNGRPYTAPGNAARWPSLAPHGVYPGREEDTWIAIAAVDDRQFDALAAALSGCDGLRQERFATNSGRVAHEDELNALIASETERHDVHELEAVLTNAGVHAGVCQTIEDRMERDPQLAARSFYPVADHAELGPRRFEGFPVLFDGDRPGIARGTPTFGQDNRAVLSDLLGFSDEEIALMIEEAAV